MQNPLLFAAVSAALQSQQQNGLTSNNLLTTLATLSGTLNAQLDSKIDCDSSESTLDAYAPDVESSVKVETPSKEEAVTAPSESTVAA